MKRGRNQTSRPPISALRHSRGVVSSSASHGACFGSHALCLTAPLCARATWLSPVSLPLRASCGRGPTPVWRVLLVFHRGTLSADDWTLGITWKERDRPTCAGGCCTTVGAHRTAGGTRAPARARQRRPAAESRGGSSAVRVDPRRRWCGIRDRCARASRPRRRRHETRPVARLPAQYVRRSPQAARRPAASRTRRRRPPAPPPRRSLATGPGGPPSQTTRRRRSPRGSSEARTSRARARARR